jgi:transcriptional regulator GlxA family with amidase domain
MSDPANQRTIVFVLYDGVQLLDVTGPAEVFALASQLALAAPYKIS